ncbi:MAG: branched-chain amino acid ABC transporter permease [Chloroflexi bacterium]|nr:branched-chain amino acid ABC transporter permease [Chloroflexota bacterium]
MDMTTLLRPRKLAAGFLFLILVFLATLPLYGSGYYIGLVGHMLMYATLGMSWAMFSGPTGYVSLGTAAFFGVGMYTSAILFGKGHQLLPLPAVVAAGGLVSFIFALLVGLVTLRVRGVYFIIFTLGLTILTKELLQVWEYSIGVRGRYLIPVSSETLYYLLLSILVAMLLAAYFMRRSRYGLALLSIGGNEEAAAHMGVNTTMSKVMAFAMSAFFMGAAGATWAPKLAYVDPVVAFSLHYSFLPVLMAIFGGIAQLYGPLIGTVAFTYLEITLRQSYPYVYMLLFGIIMIVVVLFLPGGLAGLIERGRPRLRKLISKLWKGGQAEQHANT